MHPAVEALLRWFEFDHLPTPELRQVSRPFHALAYSLALGDLGPVEGAELTVALRKLLEAKDCAVRAHITAGT